MKRIANAETRSTKPKDLELMLEEGWINRDAVQDLGDYDVSFGLKKVFFIRNPNRILWAQLANMRFTDENWIFTGPEDNLVAPLQTVKCLLTIPPNEDDNFSHEKNIVLKGDILWKPIVVDDKT